MEKHFQRNALQFRANRGNSWTWTPQLSRTFRTSFANLSQICSTKSLIHMSTHVSFRGALLLSRAFANQHFQAPQINLHIKVNVRGFFRSSPVSHDILVVQHDEPVKFGRLTILPSSLLERLHVRRPCLQQAMELHLWISCIITRFLTKRTPWIFSQPVEWRFLLVTKRLMNFKGSCHLFVLVFLVSRNH